MAWSYLCGKPFKLFGLRQLGLLDTLRLSFADHVHHFDAPRIVRALSTDLKPSIVILPRLDGHL